MLHLLLLPILILTGTTPSPVNPVPKPAGLFGEFDHLQPSSPWDRSDGALLQYLEASMFIYTGNLSIRQTKDGKYLLKVWQALSNNLKPSDIPADSAPPAQAERAIPKDLALTACSLWARTLEKVRYENSNVLISDGRQDYYAAFVHGKDWTQGKANTPREELPPKWLEQAADALMELGWHGDVPKCRKTLDDLQQKFLEYEKSHP